jgi:nucleoside-triphosphatase THEP1
MTKEKQLSSVWQKAAIVGSLWGAFEIVAGSFIHNLALPLVAGTLLSFIGVLIAVSFQSQWKVSGLLWRSAIVCAALKSISPSAVILTPMLAITLEGILLELGTLLFGINILGFIVGGGLAVLSVVAFKLVRLVMVYGQGVVDAYNSVYSMASVQLGLQPDSAWWPIIAISFIYFLIGAAASILGVIAGRKLKQTTIDFSDFEDSNYGDIAVNSKNVLISFALPIIYLVILVIYLSIQFYLNVFLSISLALIFIIFCCFRYPRVRKIMAKPGFWFPVFILSFIIPVLSFKNISDFGWLYDGAKIFFRAALVIIAFTAIGIELSSSKIKAYFINGRFKTLYQSTSLAFTTLPGYIDQLKGMKHESKRPENFISNFVNEALSGNRVEIKRHYPVIIVTADRGGGKTTFVKEVVTVLDDKKIPYAGFYAEGIWDSNKVRSEFTLVTLPEKESIKLCDTNTAIWPLNGRFHFNPAAIQKGHETVINSPSKSLVIIDEIGIMELNGDVWAKSLTSILQKDQNPVLITVRRHFLDDIRNKWNLKDATVFDATVDCPEDLVNLLITGF